MKVTAKEKAQARAFLFARGIKPPSWFILEFALAAKVEGVSFSRLWEAVLETKGKVDV